MIFDFHVHLGLAEHRVVDGDELGNLYLSYQDFLMEMVCSGVGKAIVFPIPHRDFDLVASNEYVLEAAQKSDGKLIPFCRIDENLEANLKMGFKGAKLHMGKTKGNPISYEGIELIDIKAQLHILEKYQTPLILHAPYNGTLDHILEIMAISPELPLVLAHGGRGMILTSDRVLRNAQVLKRYHNIYFEISTIENPATGNGKILFDLAELIGWDRILFGSDYPFLRERYNYKTHIDYLRKIQLGEEMKEQIFHVNAEKLLNLQDNASEITIRPTTSEDIPNIFDIFFGKLSDKDKKFLAIGSKIKYRNDWEKHISSGYSCFVAIKENKIVGYMRCYEQLKDSNSGELWDFAVDPEYRQQGIAKKMLMFLHERFTKMFAKTDAKKYTHDKSSKKFGYVAENENAPRVIKWHKS